LWAQSNDEDRPLDAQKVAQNALRNTRFRISEGSLSQEGWYQKLDAEAREQYRLSGRGIMQGLINYLNKDDQGAIAEAQGLGFEYASRGRRYGLSQVEAANALLFFRNMLIESMLNVYESAAVQSPYAWSDMFRKVNKFTDEILVTLLSTYQAFERSQG